jgi:hypothetical protein
MDARLSFWYIKTPTPNEASVSGIHRQKPKKGIIQPFCYLLSYSLVTQQKSKLTMLACFLPLRRPRYINS